MMLQTRLVMYYNKMCTLIEGINLNTYSHFKVYGNAYCTLSHIQIYNVRKPVFN